MSDPFFGPAFTDVDEQRDAPVPHRYVHGGFEGTDTRFSIYLPDGVYDGRFVHFLQGGLGGWEHQAPVLRGIEIAAECGAYLVESNQGHLPNDLSGLRGDQTILNWRASAQSSRFARDLAGDHYGSAPHHGYVFGGSGGGLRSIACLENASDLFDGAAPFMIGHGATFAFLMSVSAYAAPLVCPHLGDISDACDVGGSGDPFAVLGSSAEREALATLYRATYPRGAEFLFTPTPLYVMAMQTVLRADPSFFEDFWNVPGYAGADGEPGVDARLVETKAAVRDVVSAKDVPGYGKPSDDINVMQLLRKGPDDPIGIVLDVDEPWRLLGARLRIEGGDASGREFLSTGAVGDVVMANLDAHDFSGVAPGDEVTIGNRDYVAFSHFHRHLVDPRYAGMRQFTVDGRPTHPQRPYRYSDRGWLPSGRFDGKMIAIHHTHDRECWPTNMDDYVARVRDGGSEDRFRLWWLRNASHFVPATPAGRTRLVNYVGAWAQALRDVIAWVEDGTEPSASVPYELDADGALQTERRGGIQPTVGATANGAERAEVRVGEAVILSGTARTETGELVAVEWDLDGSGSWAVSGDAGGREATVEASHAFDEPGTYFPTFRAVTQREGDPASVRLVQDLARVRVVVTR